MADIEYIVSKTHEEPNRQKQLELAPPKLDVTPEEAARLEAEADYADVTFYFPDGSQMTADEQDLYFDFMWHPEKYEGLVPQTIEYAETYKLPDVGQISMSQIRDEVSGSGQCSLNDPEFRALINKSSGQQQAMSEYYGKNAGPWVSYDIEIIGGTQASSNANNSYGSAYYEYVYGGAVTVYDDGGFNPSLGGIQHGGFNYVNAIGPSFANSGVKQLTDGADFWPTPEASEKAGLKHYRNMNQISTRAEWRVGQQSPMTYWVLHEGGYNSCQNPIDYRATHKP